MISKWTPETVINGKFEPLTTDIADSKAKGHIYSEVVGSYKLPRSLMGQYVTAKETGYVVLPNRQAITGRLKSVWFTWCEAAYHPYVLIEKRRGDKWHVEMDNIAFYNKGPLYTLNRPDIKLRFFQQVEHVYEEMGATGMWCGGRPFVLAYIEVVGVERAHSAAQKFVQIGKQALHLAMEN